MGFWVVGSNPTSTKIYLKFFKDFPHVELDKYSPWYTQGVKRLGYIDRSARVPAIPSFQRGRVLQGQVWVIYWLTFCKWSNGLIPTVLTP